MKTNIQKIKRLSCRFASALMVCLLMMCLAVPAFAAENQYQLSGTWILNNELRGSLSTDESISFSFQAQTADVSFEVFCNHMSYTAPGDYWAPMLVYTIYDTDPEPPDVTFPFDRYAYDGRWFTDDFGEGIRTITFIGTSFVSRDFYEWFTLNASPVDITLPVTQTLPVVLGWVGSVVDSLVSGELSGLLILLAIPVAIVIVFLGARLLRRLWWGA